MKHECFDFSNRNWSSLKHKPLFFEAAAKRILFCPTNPTPNGYGFEYTSDMVQTLLDNPVPASTTFLNRRGRDFFSHGVRSNRIRLNLPERNYWLDPDGWYMQGAESTCYVWALASGIKAVGGVNNPELISNLLNQANDFYGTNKRTGLTNEDIVREAQKLNFGSNLELITASMQTLNYPDFANAIFELIDKNRFLLQGVDMSFYQPNVNRGFSHSLAVVGYKVLPMKWLDLQVIDPNFGILNIPAEYIFQHQLYDDSVAARIN
jgi:hypothetical protein